MPPFRPYALGDRQPNHGMTRNGAPLADAWIGSLSGRDALASLSGVSTRERADTLLDPARFDAMLKLAREFPAQAAYLALAAERGYGDAAIRRGVVKLAAESPSASRRWAAFFDKLADAGMAAPGVPKISGTGASPAAALPKPVAAKPALPAAPAAPARPPIAAAPPRPIKPLGTPDASVAPNNPSAPMTPVQRQGAMQSSRQVQALRLGGQHDARPVNQFLGTTTDSVQRGMAAEDGYANSMARPGVVPSQARQQAIAANARRANPMSPANDQTLGGAAGSVAGQVPRMIAGATAMAPAAAVDAGRAVTGNGADFRHLRGAAVDAASPLTKGLGVNPYGNAGERSLFGELMPGYADKLDEAGATGGSPLTRVGAKTLSPLARNAGTIAGLAGGSFAGGTAGKLMGRGAQFLGAGMAAPTAIGAGMEELAPSGVPGKSVAQMGGDQFRNARTADQLGAAINGPPSVPLQPGDNPAMQPQAVRQNAAAEGQAAAGRGMLGMEGDRTGGGPAGVQPVAGPPQGAQGAPQAPQAAPAAPAAPQAPPSPITRESLQAMTPEVAQQKGVAADQKAANLDQLLKATPPDQQAGVIQGIVGDKIAARAKLSGEDPAAMWAKAQQGGWSSGDIDNVMRSPAGPGLAEKAQQMGTDALGAFQAMPPAQQFMTAIGLPLAAIGIAQSLFGEGGMGSMLMTLLGLGAGAAGLGLFSGKGGGPLGEFGAGYGLDGVGKQVSTLFGGNTQAAKPGAVVSPQAGAPAAQPAANPAAGNPAADLARFTSDGKIDAAEGKQIMGSQAIRKHLMGLPPAQQRQLVQKMTAGDPTLGAGLDKARGALAAGGWQAMAARGMAQAQYGLSPEELDALVTASR